MRKAEGTRILAIGLGVLLLLLLSLGGGLPGSLSDPGALRAQGQEQEASPIFFVTLSYPDSRVACVEALLSPEGRLLDYTVKTAPVARGPSWLAIHPNADVTYVISYDTGALTVIRNEDCRGIRALSLGTNLYAMAFRPDGEVAYLLDIKNNRLLVLDTQDPLNPRRVATVPLTGAKAPRGLTVGQFVYVSDTEQDRVWKIDPRSHRVVEVLRTGGRCSAYVAVNPASEEGLEEVWVSDRCESVVYAYDPIAGQFTRIPLSSRSGAWFIAFTPLGEVAFVSQTDPRRGISSGKVSILDVQQKREIGVIDLSEGVAIGPGSATQGVALASLGGGEPAPAGLDVLLVSSSLGGEAFFSKTLALLISPFRRGSPSLLVPIALQTDPEGAISPINVGLLQEFSVGLERPFFSTFWGCSCKELEVSSAPLDADVKGIEGRLILPSVTHTSSKLEVRVGAPADQTCTSSKALFCEAYYRIRVKPEGFKPKGGSLFDKVKVKEVKLYIDWLEMDDKGQLYIDLGPQGKMRKSRNTYTFKRECWSLCGKIGDFPDVIRIALDFTLNEKPLDLDEVKISGRVKIDFVPSVNCWNRSGWKMVLVIKDNELDEEESDYDGDGVKNKEDQCKWEPKGKNPDPNKKGCPKEK